MIARATGSSSTYERTARGGACTGDAAAAGARRSDIGAFAEKMSYNQRIEVIEYDQAVERLGLDR
jgi:hypothetical protein